MSDKRQTITLEVSVPASCPRPAARQYLKEALEGFSVSSHDYSFNVRAPLRKMIHRELPGYLFKRGKRP